MDEKTARRYLRRQFSPVGWSLVGYYLIMNILAVLAIFAEGLAQQLEAHQAGNYNFVVDENALMNNGWGYLATIGVGFLILYAWKGGDFLYDEILAKEKKMTATVFFGVLCLCVGSQLVNSLWVMVLEMLLNLFGLSAVGILEQVSGQTDSFSMFLYASLMAPIAEELIFRGFALRTLRPFGKKFAIFGSAFLFGIFHGNLIQAPYAFLIGLVLGYVTVEYSIGWAIALHMFNNLVLADLLTRLTSLMPEMLGAAVQFVILLGFAIAAVVVLITKRHAIRAWLDSEQTDRRAVRCFFLNSGVIVLTVIMVVNMLMMLSGV
ncbi:MAG: CPBP family intramembrane metalloprotease [Oscillospiraceae bacterium]|nr:CPBP family intramembrane metalloprotease [Oscillospiraceae bacterium]